MGQYTLVLNACKASRTVGGELGTVKKMKGYLNPSLVTIVAAQYLPYGKQSM